MDAEFGWPQWVFGLSSYAFLDDGRIACIWNRDGTQHVAAARSAVRRAARSGPAVRRDRRPVHRGGGAVDRVHRRERRDRRAQVVLLDFLSRSIDVLKESEEITVDADVPLRAAGDRVPDRGRPHRARVLLPAGEQGLRRARRRAAAADRDEPRRPDVGRRAPSSTWSCATGRAAGFARRRRQLRREHRATGARTASGSYGNWGVVDTVDCINAARYLADRGEVDGDRLLIRGGSAGGYTTLCALTFHDDFAAGASYFGISDLEPFAKPGGTHKFESQYEHTLVGPYPEAADLYRARSPIHFVDMISCPMILLQGAEDEVVPPSQAEIMVARARGEGPAATPTCCSRASSTGSARPRTSSGRSRRSCRSTRRSWGSSRGMRSSRSPIANL